MGLIGSYNSGTLVAGIDLHNKAVGIQGGILHIQSIARILRSLVAPEEEELEEAY